MASFTGGPIPMAAVPVSEITSQGTVAGLVNVGFNQFLGSSITQQSGIDLSGGTEVIQTQLTPLISNVLSLQMTEVTQNTLGSIGSLASILPLASAFSTGFDVGEIVGGVTEGLIGAVGGALGGAIGGFLGGVGGVGAGNKLWPGGGGNGPSDYGGFMHNLGPNGSDVTFSITPANSGPQADGLQTAFNTPTVPTTLPTDAFTGAVPNAAAPSFTELSQLKLAFMGVA